jgi:threonine dehydratase
MPRRDRRRPCRGAQAGGDRAAHPAGALATRFPGEDEVFLKLEGMQRTGSFKLRGAYNRVATLAPEVRARGW